MFFIAHPLRKVLQPFIILHKVVFSIAHPLRKVAQPFYYCAQSRAFIIHPLRKVARINVVFIQSRGFYRTSVAEGLYLTISGKVVFGVLGLPYLGSKNRYLSTEVNKKNVPSGDL